MERETWFGKTITYWAKWGKLLVAALLLSSLIVLAIGAITGNVGFIFCGICLFFGTLSGLLVATVLPFVHVGPVPVRRSPFAKEKEVEVTFATFLMLFLMLFLAAIGLTFLIYAPLYVYWIFQPMFGSTGGLVAVGIFLFCLFYVGVVVLRRYRSYRKKKLEKEKMKAKGSKKIEQTGPIPSPTTGAKAPSLPYASVQRDPRKPYLE